MHQDDDRDVSDMKSNAQSNHRRRRSAWSLLLAALAALPPLLLALPQPARAELEITIEREGLQPMPVALPPFVMLDGQGAPLTGIGPLPPPGADPAMGRGVAAELVRVVTADLAGSGLFTALDPQAFIQDPASLWTQGPRFRDWRLLGAEAVLSGAVRRVDDQLTVDFFLHDVFQGKLIGTGKRFTAPAKDWRHIAHRIADEVYARLTGEGGYFTSRIAFIAERGGRKWLSLMDQDGANRLDLTMSEDVLVLTPQFSPDGERLFYLSYETGSPRIFRWDLYSGRRFQQGDYPGLNSTPAWSPDGTRMALTLTKDGNAEIYVKELASGTLTRLTHNSAIDTSPSWAPDGKRLVFNSNRSGSPQLYIMDADGGEARRLTFEGRYNAAPSWSPRGDWIAFVRGGGGHFRIAVTDPEGHRTRVLTDSWMDESPTWSPNGRVILFSRQEDDHTRLYTIDLTGHNERPLPIGDGLGGSDPSWSPLIR